MYILAYQYQAWRCVKLHTFIRNSPEVAFSTTSNLVEGALSLRLGGGFGGVVVTWRPIIVIKMHGILMRDANMLGERLGWGKMTRRRDLSFK